MKVGVQLYSVRNSMAANPLGTMEKVAQMGYRYLEPANRNLENDPGCGFSLEAESLVKLLGKYGAKVVNVHLSPVDGQFLEKYLRPVIRYHQAIGNHSLTSAMDFFESRDDILKKCELFNKIGRICHEEGMDFLYHNHFHEFQKFNGKTVMDYMAENTDPDYLKFEIDTFWVMRGGYDPVQVLRKYGKRVKLIHQKDFSKKSKAPVNLLSVLDPNEKIDRETFSKLKDISVFTEIGTGIMDIQSIIDAGNEIGVEYIILEQDFSSLMELQSLQISMDNFKKYSGISWD